MPRKKMPQDAGANRAARVSTVVPQNDVSPTEATQRVNGKQRDVKLSALVVHPDQPPERHSLENVAELMVSIEETTLAQPILVSRRPDGTYVILAGHRRFMAWLALWRQGKVPDRIPAFVLEGLSEREERAMMIAELMHRDRKFSPVKLAEMIGQVWDHASESAGQTLSVRRLAALVPTGDTQTGHYRKVYEALQNPELAPLVRSANDHGISNICKALNAKRFPSAKEPLEALVNGGAAGLNALLRTKVGGRPRKAVTSRKVDGGKDVTIRLRPNTTAAEAMAIIAEAREIMDVCETIVDASTKD